MVANAYAINAASGAVLPFDPVGALAPVSLLGTVTLFLGVNAQLRARNPAELIALSRSPGSNLAYASCSSGSAQHLAAEMFKSMTGADIVHVPYKGCAPAVLDVAAGQVQMNFNAFQNMNPHHCCPEIDNCCSPSY